MNMQIVELRLAVIVVAEIANVNSNERAEKRTHGESIHTIYIIYIINFDFHIFPIRYG